ncbi:MAG: hypothetical protein IE926_05430 [Micrococcales bacterium]|uniref:hypothetical protein n=1 Tax=Phycicoccus sp. TaxID=1902410 RepID=UPI001998AD93|nr:hypothetical protein [Phycicoccus sp.]MBD3782387.1 hypothetical protein [Micrococcales bacterium]HMM94510.1 hypothetical protein [Phycicoccus sp.]
MSQTPAIGAGRAGIVMLLLSIIVGLGISFAAAATIIQANGPKDSNAVTTGPQDVLPADQLLGYGS